MKKLYNFSKNDGFDYTQSTAEEIGHEILINDGYSFSLERCGTRYQLLHHHNVLDLTTTLNFISYQKDYDDAESEILENVALSLIDGLEFGHATHFTAEQIDGSVI